MVGVFLLSQIGTVKIIQTRFLYYFNNDISIIYEFLIFNFNLLEKHFQVFLIHKDNYIFILMDKYILSLWKILKLCFKYFSIQRMSDYTKYDKYNQSNKNPEQYCSKNQ